MANAMMIIIGGIGLMLESDPWNNRFGQLNLVVLGFIRDGDDACGRGDELTMAVCLVCPVCYVCSVCPVCGICTVCFSFMPQATILPFWEMRALFASLLPPPR